MDQVVELFVEFFRLTRYVYTYIKRYGTCMIYLFMYMYMIYVYIYIYTYHIIHVHMIAMI